jgi:hypothetical protein
MRTRRPGLLVPVLLATAGLGFSGCGGGGDGGDEEAYVKTYEGACKAIAQSGTTFEKSAATLAASATKDPEATIKGLKDGVSNILTTFAEQVDVMAGADAPEKWEAFQASISAGAGKAQASIAKAKAALADVRTTDDFAKIGTTLNGVDIGGGTIPKDLATAAPSCKTLGSGSATS